MGPNTDPWGTPLMSGRQLDFAPFTTTHWARPSSQFLTQQRVYLSKPRARLSSCSALAFLIFFSAYAGNFLVLSPSCLSLLPPDVNSLFLLDTQQNFPVQPRWSSSPPAHLQHTGTACSCAFKTSFLRSIQPSWTPLPFRTDSQGTLPTSVLNSLKSALRKSRVAV